jgi:hypothetical protein
VCLGLLACSSLLACSEDGEGGADGASADAPAVRSHSQEGEGSVLDTVDVFLEEYRISMPAEVAAGTVLRIVNIGFETHNLRFRLPGTDSILQETVPDLNPGETRYMAIAVPPGPYSVVCDFGGHSGRGMRTDAEVVEGPAGH